VILAVWVVLIVLTTIYCYFCEQRLFPSNAQQRLNESQFSSSTEGGNDSDSNDISTTGHLNQNKLSSMAASLPKGKIKGRKEVSTMVCYHIASVHNS
jgi:hypothetical protein